MEEERKNILQALETGEITAEEAQERLAALEAPAPPVEPVSAPPINEHNLPHISELRGNWQLPFFASLLSLAVAGGKISGSRRDKGLFNRLRLNFYWLAFLASGIVAALSIWSRDARWLQINIESADGHHINLSLPVPVHLLARLLRAARPYVTDREDAASLDAAIEFIDSMQDQMESPDGQPVMIDINEDGNRVQVYFL